MKIPRIAISLLIATTFCAVPVRAAITTAEPPLTEAALVDWLAAFNTLDANMTDSGLNLELIAHLNSLKDWIRSREDIDVFRRWENDDQIVRGIIPYAAGPRPETRSPATLVLGNVVDNTNVCYVIAYLMETPEIGADGRFNLLQVVRQVADYAFSDTAVWINALVDLKEAQLVGQEDVSNTLQLLRRTREAVLKRSNGQLLTLRSLSSSNFASCVAALPTSIGGGSMIEPLFPDTIADLSADLLQQRLFSDDRREYATHLAALYDQADEAGRAALVSAIIAAIIPPKALPDLRYRVNLYIAVTFTRMASGALTEPAWQEALLALRTSAEYLDDPTFVQNVDQAIAKQGL